MCGECTEIDGLHVPEDLVHLDVYDPQMQAFVKDGECGRAVLTTLLPVGRKSGMLLINYDTEDTTVVLSRDRCACGRTHMRIVNPEREAETVWVHGNPFNRVDIEAAVFQSESMEYISGEYESFVTLQKDERSPDPDKAALTVRLECFDPDRCDRGLVEDRFTGRFFRNKPGLKKMFSDGDFALEFEYVSPRGLALFGQKGRPKRLADRRSAM